MVLGPGHGHFEPLHLGSGGGAGLVTGVATGALDGAADAGADAAGDALGPPLAGGEPAGAAAELEDPEPEAAGVVAAGSPAADGDAGCPAVCPLGAVVCGVPWAPPDVTKLEEALGCDAKAATIPNVADTLSPVAMTRPAGAA